MKTGKEHSRKFIVLSALGVAALLASTSATAQTYLSQTATKNPRPTDEIKFESQSVLNSFIHIENGPLVVTPIKEEAWSSRWYVEPVGESDFVRIKNRWTGCYLNTEQGPLVCGPQQAEWWSAQWRLVPDVDVKYSIINRWTECKLTNAGAGLRCMKNATKTADNLWRPINLTPQTSIAVRRRPKPTAPPPLQASEPPAPAIDEFMSALFNTTDGPNGDEFNLSGATERAVLAGMFDEDIEVITVFGQYAQFIGYEDPNFRGRTVTLRCGRYELIGDPENEISSIKIIKAERPVRDCPSPYEGVVEIHNWDR
jgi:hypothetical protein